MNAEELYTELGNSTVPDMEIIIEAGGDGAIHVGSLVSIRIEEDRVILSTEGG
jgi:hypothetical protein